MRISDIIDIPTFDAGALDVLATTYIRYTHRLDAGMRKKKKQGLGRMSKC